MLVALGALAVPSLFASGVALGVASGFAQDASRAAAERADKKMQAIMMRAVAAPAKAPALKTTFTEEELNAYMRVQPDLPTGLTQPTVQFLDNGRVQSRALVNLDIVRTSEKRGWLDPLAYVTGILEVHLIGVFRGANGQGVYTFESARVGGAPVPKSVLQELLAFYTRTPETPKGILLDTPFELPANIREVELRRGMATVIQ
jgi:hypothetical protein